MKRPLALIILVAITAGCQQQMAEQPSYRPLEPSAIFADGTSARPLPAGVVAREWSRSDDAIVTALSASSGDDSSPDIPDADAQTPRETPLDPSRFVSSYPFKITRDDLDRGQQRYTIFCALCHDPIGNGQGKIVERGYVRPPSFHEDNSRGFARYGKAISLRDVPPGYLFEVISRGYGAMPRYGPQIPPGDRWRIVAYVRALQLSQHAVINELPDAVKRDAIDSLEASP